MGEFGYQRAGDVSGAVALLEADPDARFLGGGTNLVDLMKTGVERPARASGQRDQAGALVLEPDELQVRLLVRLGFEERARVQAHQAAIAALARRQKNDAWALQHGTRAGTWTAVLIEKIDRERATDNRLNARRRHFVRVQFQTSPGFARAVWTAWSHPTRTLPHITT